MLKLINKICGELPEHFCIEMWLENGSAHVQLYRNSIKVAIDSSDMTLEEELEEALRVAKECS